MPFPRPKMAQGFTYYFISNSLLFVYNIFIVCFVCSRTFEPHKWRRRNGVRKQQYVTHSRPCSSRSATKSRSASCYRRSARFSTRASSTCLLRKALHFAPVPLVLLLLLLVLIGLSSIFILLLLSELDS